METTAELYRLLYNLIKIGTVLALNDKDSPPTARVKTGQNESDWIRWASARAGNTTVWLPPVIGEQVIILSPGGDMSTAFIIGSLYSGAHPAPAHHDEAMIVQFGDVARIAYTPSSGEMEITAEKSLTISTPAHTTIHCGDATVQAKQRITLDAPDVICTQKLTAAQLSITKGGEINGAFSGQMTLNGVRPDKHSHGGVEGGGSWTEGTK
ncbi:phage baseplate assembly protein V [Serratia bockelmannii]|uniref:phage baseplate assembly protein V n=1 Tax=Serratia bockelmannii TaxID=2703793 RepID=UPI003FA7EB80